MQYKTPGVYIKEVSIFPPSIAAVETAIPAFVGYTEKAERDGENILNQPTMVGSMLEFHQLFGGPYETQKVDVVIDETNNFAVNKITIAPYYHLYDALRLFYDNGGGDCYISAVGLYDYSSTASSDSIKVGDENNPTTSPGLRVGLNAFEKMDKPTILLFPDAIELKNKAEFYGLQQMALSQCNLLQDRVAVLDLKENMEDGWKKAVEDFRQNIGINNLKYGMAYTPFLCNSFDKKVPYQIFQGNIKKIDGTTTLDPLTLSTDSDLNNLISKALDAISDEISFKGIISNLKGTEISIKEKYRKVRAAQLDQVRDASGSTANADLKDAVAAMTAVLQTFAAEVPKWKNTTTNSFKGSNLINDLEAYAKDSFISAMKNLIALEKNTKVKVITTLSITTVNTLYAGLNDLGWISSISANDKVTTITGSLKEYLRDTPPAYTLDEKKEAALLIISDLDTIFEELLGFIASIENAAYTHIDLSQKILYESHPIIGNIVKAIKKAMTTIPPSGAIAGLYAFVDTNRGVYKAPANVSINNVISPSIIIDDRIQENLNVDVDAGKSINAIRAFTGKGTLVWGARTLAGNDNEWRYVNVRRYFNFVEESIKKGTGWAVFEPNDANTWSKVRTSVSNFLIDQWRQGALQGATPEEAFFVRVGLGLTMTYQEVLEGLMRVKIGIAVVRPAEFIELEFTHKAIDV